MKENHDNLFFKLVAGGVVFVFILFGVFVWGFHALFAKFEQATIHLIAAVLATLIVFGFFPTLYIGYYFGKSEARGWLQGADKMADKGWGYMTSAFNTRTSVNNKTTNNAGLNTPPTTIFIPGVAAPPAYTPRQQPFEEETYSDTIDLS